MLWVGLPGGTKVTDVELYNAFLPCGGLERVKSFSERNYAFVQFSSAEAASHAKTVMQVRQRIVACTPSCSSEQLFCIQGRFVGEARLTLKFSNSTAAAGNEAPKSAGCANLASAITARALTCTPATALAAAVAESARRKVSGEAGAARAAAAVAAAAAAAAAALSDVAAVAARALAPAALPADLAVREPRDGIRPLRCRCR